MGATGSRRSDANFRALGAASSRVCTVHEQSQPVRVFVGSSAEGREVARHLQAELGATCEVVRWDQSVFAPSGYALDSLLVTAAAVDFAVLVATPDDKTISRGETAASARDNIVLEFGLFAGALGRDRTYLLATGDIKLPTDVLGLTRLTYRPQSNGRAAVTEAALQIEQQILSLGRLPRHAAPEAGAAENLHSLPPLEKELTILCSNAVSQGWAVKDNSITTLRLCSPQGKVYALSKSRPENTRIELRRFAAEIRAAGVRVNNSVRRPVEESPW